MLDGEFGIIFGDGNGEIGEARRNVVEPMITGFFANVLAVFRVQDRHAGKSGGESAVKVSKASGPKRTSPKP